MTDTPDTKDKPANNASKIWTDLGPVLAFVVSYNVVRRFPEGGGLLSRENAVYWATGIFMAAIAAVFAYTLSRKERLSPLLIVTGVIVMVFGGLTLWLQSPQFAYYKPTIINLLFAGLIFGGLAFGKNVWKIAFEHAFNLPDHAWRVFAIRWGLFYIFLAIMNEVIWRNFSEDFWANSKIFLVLPASMIFMIVNYPYLMKHSLDQDSEDKG
ncbi:MAG: intracellular septation protein A [Hirschia sp.]|nr:intracellular septation protein A [Hirschia sp.]MBF18786.1 intracellular septation protein A [Hirschia sp.]|tara:strand:+ start:78 stop:710 length:633 start_codon:yes stop_codon:yes gene_type:complete